MGCVYLQLLASNGGSLVSAVRVRYGLFQRPLQRLKLLPAPYNSVLCLSR